MKNTLKLITLLIVTLIVTMSCKFDETNFDSLHKDIDPNATYYLQFTNASQLLETTVDLDGVMHNIDTSVSVVLLGVPQAQDIIIDLSIDPSSTITGNMYTLSSNTLTIPAGKTSGSVNLKSIFEEFEIGESATLVLNMNTNGHDATQGTQLNYTLKRIKFCDLVIEDLVGTYSELSEDNPNALTTISNVSLGTESNELVLEGVYSELFSIWGETFQPGFGSEGKVSILLSANGDLEIPCQYMGQTLPGPWDYWVSGTGKFDMCEKIITLTFGLQSDDSCSTDFQVSTVVIQLN